MSTLGTIQQHTEHGLSRAEAERLEALVLRCDQAAETAAALGDDELTRPVIAAAQGLSAAARRRRRGRWGREMNGQERGAKCRS